MYAPCITKHRRKESSINIVQDDPWGWHHIGFHRAVLRVEVDQGQRADKRNQSQEDEPCPLAGILQTAYRNGQKYRVGLNYVSCSPFRVPIARLAAAQAAVEDEK